MNNDVVTIILAAGKSTRMKSALPKTLHPIAGRPMLGHVLEAVGGSKAASTILVIGPDMDNVADYAKSITPKLGIAIQHNQRGTGDAVKAAMPQIAATSGVALVIFGDTPLVRAETLTGMADACTDDTPIVVLGFEAADPTGYGRLVLDAKGVPS